MKFNEFRSGALLLALGHLCLAISKPNNVRPRYAPVADDGVDIAASSSSLLIDVFGEASNAATSTPIQIRSASRSLRGSHRHSLPVLSSTRGALSGVRGPTLSGSLLQGSQNSVLPSHSHFDNTLVSMARSVMPPSPTVLQSAITPAPKPHCTYRAPDPDSGVNLAYCICQGSMTVPLLTVPSGAIYTEACDYSSMPQSTLSTNTSIYGPPRTNSALCEVEQQVGPNEDVASRISGCAVPITTTSGAYVLLYTEEVIDTQTPTAVGGGLGTPITVTEVRGVPSTISTLPPAFSVMTSTGTGVFVGQMTGSALWYNISTAVVSACSGSAWPVTSCPTATITGVPYPSQGSGSHPFVSEGEFEIAFDVVNVTDITALESLAYQMGANLALSIARSKSMCTDVTTIKYSDCGLVTHCQSSGQETFHSCYVPSSLVIEEYSGNNNYGPDSKLWATFSFEAANGNNPEVSCDTVADIIHAVLGFVMLFAWLAGPEAEALAVAGNIASQASKAVDKVSFGCNAIQNLENPMTSTTNVAPIPEDTINQLTQALSDSSTGIDHIGKVWEALVAQIPH